MKSSMSLAKSLSAELNADGIALNCIKSYYPCKENMVALS